MINIHSGLTEDYLKERMTNINQKAKNLNEEIWVFFDDLNTYNSFALLTEIL